MENCLVYTSNTNSYDPVMPNTKVEVYIPTEFSDEPINSIVKARKQKILMSTVKPWYDYYLYVDGNVLILDPNIIDTLKEHLGIADIVFIRHTYRLTTGEEAAFLCTEPRFWYIHKAIKEQYEYYKTQGYPDDMPLPCTGLMFYRWWINKEFFRHWFDDVKNRQPRDQISVWYNLWKYGILFNIIDCDFYCNPMFTGTDHTVNTYRKYK